MAEKEPAIPIKVEKLKESVNGINKLSPSNLEIGKSLNGIVNLAPQNLQSPVSNSPQGSSKTASEQQNSDGEKK